MIISIARPLLPVLLLLAGACTPYTVASTAHTVPKGQRTSTSIFYVVPGGARAAGDSSTVSMPGFDLERRFGLDDRTDIGLRVPTFSGAIVTYKRRLTPYADRASHANAVSFGVGLVNGGQHAHTEATFIASGRETGSVAAYGGIRAIQVVPLTTTAAHDSPTVGGFGGMRLGGPDAAVSLELGVFYDRSALKMRRGDLVIVPAISLHGSSISRLLPW